MDRIVFLQEYFLSGKLTLAIAESCTGGALAYSITRNPGASRYFLGSFVTYCDAWKHSVLRVPCEVLEEEGAVSASTVLSLLDGIFSVSRADFAIAVSGIAGPEGGSEEHPVGTVWIATGSREAVPDCEKIVLSGTRECIMQGAAEAALDFLYRYIQKKDGL